MEVSGHSHAPVALNFEKKTPKNKQYFSFKISFHINFQNYTSTPGGKAAGA
jgi:hypothetical protein